MACPLEINLMLHHYARADAFDHPSPAATEYEAWLQSAGLLTPADEHGVRQVTEGGKMYVDALMSVPFPHRVWAMPDEAA